MVAAPGEIMDKLAIVGSVQHNFGRSRRGVALDPDRRRLRRAEPAGTSPQRRLGGREVPGGEHAGVPPYVAIPRPPAFAYAGYPGARLQPVQPRRRTAGGTKARVKNLDATRGVSSMERISERKNSCIETLDRVNRRRDLSGTMAGMDRFTTEAYAMITGPAAQRAFDLSTREEPKYENVTA